MSVTFVYTLYNSIIYEISIFFLQLRIEKLHKTKWLITVLLQPFSFLYPCSPNSVVLEGGYDITILSQENQKVLYEKLEVFLFNKTQ